MKSVERETDYTCPECNKPLVCKMSRGSWFLGCKGYPECKFTASVDSEGHMVQKEPPMETEFECPTCHKKLVIREGRYGKFFACSGYPECKTTLNIGDDGQPVERKKAATVDEKCPDCGSPMVKRWKGRKPFLACSAYPKCKTTRSLGPQQAGKGAAKTEPTDIDCPECGKKMVIRKGRYGKFLACSGYPQCKTTRKIEQQEESDS